MDEECWLFSFLMWRWPSRVYTLVVCLLFLAAAILYHSRENGVGVVPVLMFSLLTFH